MPTFAKVETQVDFPALERHILEFWDKTDAFEKLRAKNRGQKRWSFLDGPITANNPMGVHHAWGRTYKDAYQRYFAMTGHDQRYQNGFDCQGLWVEVEVEKEMKLQSKRDIENLVPGDRFASIDKFVAECKARVDKFARVQTEQSIRLGMWMNWDRTDADWAKTPDERKSYFTMSEENNYTIWSFLKKCHERKLIYRGFDAMPWCGRCGVGISQQEQAEGYKLVAHRSVFVKFPIRRAGGVSPLIQDAPQNQGADAPRSPENLLVWTTTPWTLTSNVAAAVNPELTYIKVKSRDEIYYVAKGAFTAKRKEEEFKRKEWLEGVPKLNPIEQHFKAKGPFEIVGEVKGADMIGWMYEGPFDELPAQDHAYGYPDELAEVVRKQNWAPARSAKESHRVIAWKDVGETEGTGIVHIAPGCGREDFQLGKEQGVPPVAPLDESGVFIAGFGELTGKNAVDPATAEFVLKSLQEKGRLFASEQYPHTYPHCWRCKTELLFRLVDEWFIGMSWRDEIMEVVRQVTFLPESINGQARELDWLKNMGDWMISKKRYWGLALPIWVDEQTGDFEVIGSREELKARAVEGWSEFDGHTPHRPWIDKIKIKNPKSGNLMSRIPDVGNPWLDAGIVPYSTLGYNQSRQVRSAEFGMRSESQIPSSTPHSALRTPHWEEWFPADFITECFPGQFRNWFYSLLALSTMMTNRAPFKKLLGHGLVRDEKGEEMHKAKGNSIEFNSAAETMGADVCRWMYCRTTPDQNINFGPGPANEIRAKFHLKLWNSYAFFVNYARLDGFEPGRDIVPVAERPDIDRWILSDLQLLVRTARKSFEAFDVKSFCQEAERFIDDKLSNWYIRRNRRRFWKGDKGRDKDAAYHTLYEVLTTLTKLIAPVVPFLAETLWQNLAGTPASVHLCDYPDVDEKLIDKQLSEDMQGLFDLVTLGSAARNAAKLKVRQPLAELRVQPANDAQRRALTRFSDQLCDELNIRRATAHEGGLLKIETKANRKTLGPKAGPRLQEIIAAIEKLDTSRGLSFPLELKLAGDPFVVLSDDVQIAHKAEDGWAGAAGDGTMVAIDTRITEELKLAGQAREVVRFVQDLRKKAGLQAEDRIALVLATDAPGLEQAIESHRDYIAEETLTREWPATLEGDATTVQVDGQALTIALRKV